MKPCFGHYDRQMTKDRGCTSCGECMPCKAERFGTVRIGDEPPKTHDAVNHPSHYASGEIECIDAIRAALGLEGFIAHCRGTAIKYAWRAGKKGEAAECLRKGAWYLTRAAEALEAE